MSIQNRTTLKTYFETNDFPSQEEFGHLIDSMFNKSDDEAIFGLKIHSTYIPYKAGTGVLYSDKLYRALIDNLGTFDPLKWKLVAGDNTILEFETFYDFPSTGVSNIIYIDKSNNHGYRFQGVYILIFKIDYNSDDITEGAVNKYYTVARSGENEKLTNKGVANGYAGLDAGGKVPSVQLPSYVDDVLEVADYASLPVTGESGKIYVLLTPYTNPTTGILTDQFRWSGSVWVGLVSSPGTTDAISEGAVNKFFTTARVLTTTLLGWVVGADLVITAADTISQSFGKVQAQINAIKTSLGLKEDKSQKGFANGYGSLNGNGKQPLTESAVITTPITSNVPAVAGNNLQDIANNSNYINRLVKEGYITAKLYNWFLKLSNLPSLAKILWLGDSTSDFTSNAIGIPSYLNDTYTFPNDVLDGFNVSANMPNFGANGMTLSAWLTTPNAANGLNNVVAANPDLIIFSFLINDVRQNLVDVALGKSMLIQAIDSIRAALPNTDIVLRMPNSFSIPTSNFYIKLTGTYAPVGGYASLAIAAQAQSDILYQIYYQLKDYWSNVYLYNSQELTFGRTAIALPNTLHSDEIHPQYQPVIDDIAKIIGLKAPFSKQLSVNAITNNYSAPWNIYKRAFENTDYFTKIGNGRYGTQTVTYWDIIADTQDEALRLATNVRIGDFMVIGNTVFTLPAFTISNPSTGYYRIAYAIPANTITGGRVTFYRHNYNLSPVAESYINNRGAYPYIRKVIFNGGGANYMRVTANYNGYPIADYGSSPIQAGRLQFTTSDVMILADGTVIPFTGLSFFVINDTTYQINITGSYASLVGQYAIIAGNHTYEDPYPKKTGIQALFLDLATPVTGTFGLDGIRGFKVRTLEGKVGLPNIVFLDSTEPAGNTIVNTVTTKVAFTNRWTTLAGTLYPQKVIKLESDFLLSTATVTAGTLIISVELGGTVIAQTAPIALTNSLVNQLIHLRFKIYAKSIDGSQTIVTYMGLGSFNIIGIQDVPLATPTTVNVNNGGNADVTISAQFSVANSQDTIVMKALEVFSDNP
jgi:hypothetical protein